MHGRDFWTLFNAAKIPQAELIGLGEDIGYTKDSPSAPGASALLKLSYVISRAGAKVNSELVFTALKAEMPGLFSRKSLLEGLAADYSSNKSYDTLGLSTREYIDAVAKRLPSPAPKANVLPAQGTPATVSPAQGPRATAPQGSIPQGSTPQGKASTASAPTPATTIPKGLSEVEWNFLRAVVSKLASGQGAKVSANNLASARNLAERAKLKVLEALDAEIANRGDGAQNPPGDTPSANNTPSSPGPSDTGRASVSPLAVTGLLAALFFLFRYGMFR
jgi:hypothetical protein